LQLLCLGNGRDGAFTGYSTRVVVGYTNGEYDARHHQQVIRGTDAHSWVQVYFAGYGWVNLNLRLPLPHFRAPNPISSGG